jgi:MarR family transcriptional regulator, negative regulator of the multidrug operon emrRAB
MSTNPAHSQGPIELRASEIEAAVGRASARFAEIPGPETLILRLLMLLGRELSSLLEEALRPHDLNDTDFRILISLISQPDGAACPSDLCTDVAQSPANMTRVADVLYERGLITRTASEQDRRRTMLRITPAGESLVKSLLPVTTEITRTIFTDVPTANRRVLLDQLRTLAGQIDRVARSK